MFTGAEDMREEMGTEVRDGLLLAGWLLAFVVLPPRVRFSVRGILGRCFLVYALLRGPKPVPKAIGLIAKIGGLDYRTDGDGRTMGMPFAVLFVVPPRTAPRGALTFVPTRKIFIHSVSIDF